MNGSPDSFMESVGMMSATPDQIHGSRMIDLGQLRRLSPSLAVSTSAWTNLSKCR